MVVKESTVKGKYNISDIDEYELDELKKAIENGSLPLKRTFYELSFQIEGLLKSKSQPKKK
jgi:hypothetical protein